MSTQISALLELSPDEKLDIIAALWESLSESPELVPIHDWQQRELDRRQAAYDSNPEPLLTWEEVQANILAKYA
jgi:putative addiction module component (TIGR02574 family)